MKIALLNHGCAKNLVDAELMLGFLADKGYEITLDENDAQIVIVNTCSFIHDAEKESVQAILKMIEAGKKVFVTGCLPQKHKNDLKEAIPEIAGMLGPSEIDKIVEIIEEQKYSERISDAPKYNYPETVERRQITMGASSYLKIADGCNYSCGFCIIPQLRGKYSSRPIEKIVDEAKALAKKGVTEIVLVAQDTTGYGQDLYGELALPRLLRELNKIEDLAWIRIMYAYPTTMNDELLEAIASLDKVVKYVDIPLQHCNTEVLKSMLRPAGDYDKLVKNVRDKIPGVAIRTAFIVGYPGETEEQFEELYEFVKRSKFEKMGVFEYSREKNTPSYGLKPLVSAKTMKERREKLMALQQEISRGVNENYIGKTLPCIVEGFTDDGVILLRSQYDAPEIDGMVYAKSKSDFMPVPGDIEDVLITGANDYDLFGEIK